VDFAFSAEQEMLRSQAREFLADRIPNDRVAELAGSDAGWDPATWKQMAELGWIGLSAPEGAGGAGMSFLDEAVLIEELGYALYPGPYLSTVGFALPALERDPELVAEVVAGDSTATFTENPQRVPDGAIADVVVVAAGGSITAHRRADVEVRELGTVDRTRRFARVVPSGNGRVLAEGDDATGLLEHIRRRSLAAVSLEAVGIAQKALDLAHGYVKERQQFDKPIGIYQAVSHQVADTYLHVELARSLAYWAAWCVAESDEQVDRATAAAKVQATDAAVFACERSIQVHGGIGFTWEHILHRYYKRAQWLRSYEGNPSAHLRRIASALLPA
jgi:alkylation response protein AidB-like acyl-CoA dehydrogenase